MLKEKSTYEPRTYLNVRHGAIVKRDDNGVDRRYEYVEGIVEGIYKRTRTFGTEQVPYWYVDLRDADDGTLYALAFTYDSNVFKSLVLQLASDDGIAALRRQHPVRITAWERDNYTRVALAVGDVRLKWKTTDLPAREVVQVGERTITDDTARMKFIETTTAEVVDAINSGEGRV